MTRLSPPVDVRIEWSPRHVTVDHLYDLLEECILSDDLPEWDKFGIYVGEVYEKEDLESIERAVEKVRAEIGAEYIDLRIEADSFDDEEAEE